MRAAPDFIAGRDQVGRAFEYAQGVYAGPGLEPGADLEHPLAVAAIVDGAGFEDDAVAAALLHDIVEDSTTTSDDVAALFGPEIGGWVEVLTEDISIADYHARKDEHRRRVLAGGSVTASIYLADKLARTRALAAQGGAIDPDRLEHYWDTLELFAGRRPELPFLSELAAELPELSPAEGSG
ncbi:MAG: HD domain-containing protein [Solirubrobacterales bacterium]|nr:HD domain-containing protein [Solirubrobacterales bacterium]